MIHLSKQLLKRLLSQSQWETFRTRWWRYVRPLTVNYCPVMLPWFYSARRDDAAARLHRLAMSFHWQNERSLLTSLCVLVAFLRWPFRFTWDAGRCAARYAPGVARLYHVTIPAQLKAIAWLGGRYNLPPLCYYQHRMFEPGNAARAHGYLHKDEMSMIYPALALGADSDLPLRLKHRFHELGMRNGLPVVEAIAWFADGTPQAWYAGAPGDIPATDLVLKPVDQAGGLGFQLWVYDAATARWNRDGISLDAGQLLAHCAESSRLHAHILQRRLANHAALRPLSGQALSTIRIVTYHRPNGTGGVLLAGLRIAGPNRHNDNMETGGVVAPIDLASGTLGSAVDKYPVRLPLSHHPETGAPIAGRQVPYFPEAMQASLAAHACFPWIPFVGWDVVIAENGPLLLEANPDWGIEIAQIILDGPLTGTLYPDVYFEHLARRLVPIERHGDPATSNV